MDFSTILPLLNQNKLELDLIHTLQQKKQNYYIFRIWAISLPAQGAAVILWFSGQTPETSEDKKNIPSG